MKKIILLLTIFSLFIIVNTTNATIKSYQIAIDSKSILDKNLEDSKNKLKIIKSGEVYIKKIDLLISKNKSNSKNLVNIYNKIWEIRKTLEKKNTKKASDTLKIINYIQYKIGDILYLDDSVGKIKFNPNIP